MVHYVRENYAVRKTCTAKELEMENANMPIECIAHCIADFETR